LSIPPLTTFSSSKLDTNLTNRTNNTDFWSILALIQRQKLSGLSTKIRSGVRAVRVFLNLEFLCPLCPAQARAENNDEEDKQNILRENLFDMINLLSAELGLGGKIDTARTIKIETKMFPNIFRQRLIAELQKELNADLELITGEKMGAFEFGKITSANVT